MPRKFFKKYLPEPEAILARRWAAPFRPWLGHPNLWHLNRRSVPGAVAAGLFSGLIPGPFQMLGALAICMAWKKNIPVALLLTLYTNPFTIVPLYLIAFAYGSAILGERGSDRAIRGYEWEWSLAAFVEWVLSLGKPLGLGLLALALTLAIVGYFISELAWRIHVVLAWRARRRTGSISR